METTFEPPKPAPTVQPTARLTDPVSPETTLPVSHPLLTLDVKALGAALREMITKTINYAESRPAPRTSRLSTADLLEIVLHELKAKYSGKVMPAAEIRQTLDKVCGNRANEVGHLLYPLHVLRLGKTDLFVFRDDKFRAPEFRGLVPDSSGILPDEPMPF